MSDGDNPIIQDTIAFAYAMGVITVASAGNEGKIGSPIHYPASYPHVIGVGATDHNDVVADFSSYGSWVDVSAPGVSILSTNMLNHYYGDYAKRSGTSMASPYVAGTAALLLSYNPNLTVDQVEQILKETARDLGAPGKDDYFGYGRIDAFAALQKVDQTYSQNLIGKITNPTTNEFTLNNPIIIQGSASDRGQCYFFPLFN